MAFLSLMNSDMDTIIGQLKIGQALRSKLPSAISFDFKPMRTCEHLEGEETQMMPASKSDHI